MITANSNRRFFRKCQRQLLKLAIIRKSNLCHILRRNFPPVEFLHFSLCFPQLVPGLSSRFRVTLRLGFRVTVRAARNNKLRPGRKVTHITVYARSSGFRNVVAAPLVPAKLSISCRLVLNSKRERPNPARQLIQKFGVIRKFCSNANLLAPFSSQIGHFENQSRLAQ